MNEAATVDTFFGFSRLPETGSEALMKVLQDLPIDRIRAAIQDRTISAGGGDTQSSEAEEVKQPNPNLALYITAESILDSLASLLEIPMWDVIKQAWTEGKLFERYCDPNNYDPNETIHIVLKDHEMSSDYEPSIDVVLNDRKLCSIQFQLAMSLTLSQAGLKVRNGQVLELQAGQIVGTASLAVEGLPLFEKEGEMELSDIIHFTAQAESTSTESSEDQ